MNKAYETETIIEYGGETISIPDQTTEGNDAIFNLFADLVMIREDFKVSFRKKGEKHDQG